MIINSISRDSWICTNSLLAMQVPHQMLTIKQGLTLQIRVLFICLLMMIVHKIHQVLALFFKGDSKITLSNYRMKKRLNPSIIVDKRNSHIQWIRNRTIIKESNQTKAFSKFSLTLVKKNRIKIVKRTK